MAKIRAFRGWRYKTDGEQKDISNLCAPPYDVIDAVAREGFASLDSRNVVRLELPEGSDDPDSPNNKYRASSEQWHAWQKDGTLVQDELPAIYMLEQRFDAGDGSGSSSDDGDGSGSSSSGSGGERARICFIVEMDLYSFEDEVVFPHELTLPKALGDRFALISATNVNFSQVMALYSDKSESYMQVVAAVRNTEPVSWANCPDGVQSTLWAITDPKLIDMVIASLDSKQVFIADGHHRYTVALAWRDHCRKMAAGGAETAVGATAADEETCEIRDTREATALQTSSAELQPKTDSIMIALTNMDDPQLQILAYNRAVKAPSPSNSKDLPTGADAGAGVDTDKSINTDTFDPKSLIEGARNLFDIEFAGSACFEQDDQANELVSKCQKEIESKPRPAFALATRNSDEGFDVHLLTLRDEVDLAAEMGTAHSQAWRELDVSVLHELVISPLLGVLTDKPETLSRITYSQNVGKLLKKLKAKEYDVVFAMRPTQLEQLKQVSLGGEIMPQKSTFFYPKLPSGLVFRDMEQN